jgi:cbb3-type cytochrome oxidase subunit 3
MTKQASNMAKQGVNTYQKSSTMGKVIFFIILILFIILIIYIIYAAVKASQAAAANSPVIVNDVINAYVAYPAFTLPQVTQGMNQSFSTWIYVADWNYKFGQYKNILWKGQPSSVSTTSGTPSISNVHCPSLWLYPLTNSLKVVTSTSVPEQVESCDIQNIPLMTWVHIVYVLNNRTVDIYINGKLERSCALRGIPTITNDPVYITQGSPQAGYYGQIGKTQYFTYALLPNNVANLYQQGPLGTTQYQIQFFTNGQFISITNGNNLTNSS